MKSKHLTQTPNLSPCLPQESAGKTTLQEENPFELDDISAELSGIVQLQDDRQEATTLEPINKDFLTKRDRAFNRVCERINEFELGSMVLNSLLSQSASRACCVKSSMLHIQDELNELALAFDSVICCPACREFRFDPMHPDSEMDAS